MSFPGHPFAAPQAAAVAPLYTAEQRRRRDATRWTMVQGVLAPLQFLVCALSIGLVLHWWATGSGWQWAVGSFVLKTALLYTIMVTGCLWEREVFGQYLFAAPFFWEDVVSMGVIALHTACLVALVTGGLAPKAQMALALAAYAAYIVNAVQFLLKLRAARRAQTLVSASDSAAAASHHLREQGVTP
jgi:3-vinyl bacteriochlorophyllide hydratase